MKTLIPLLLLGTASCNAWLVGGECLPGFEQRDQSCVAIEEQGGRGGASSHGGGGQASAGGASGGAAPHGGAGGAGAGAGQGGTGGAGGNGAGGGGTAGSGGTGGGLDCGPLEPCGGECVDLDSDPQNCGSCGHECQTGLCGAGQCQGAFAGHTTAIGIDYGVVPVGSSAARLLGNAVFLYPADPVKIAVYTQYASPQVASQVPLILSAEAQARGRTTQPVMVQNDAQLADIAAMLAADVIIVPPSPGADPGVMSSVGAGWAQPLFDFAAQGGVVIFLADASSEDVLDATDLLGPLDLTPEPMGPCSVSSWLDALSVGVFSPFALAHPVTSLVPSAPLDATTQVVVTTSDGSPVVIHRVVIPPI